ncbi:hypothetical protein ACFSC4_01960 [Deinococcus malanensis]|uniref:hypothetical protein n=1 Tax=Deinococcus malanensis TaxID=1706855 RepID=UPI00362ADF6B
MTVRGVVTLDTQPGLSGFYLQDVRPDADNKTSDAVFVFTGTASKDVKVGDVVQVTGTVKEFNGLTEIDPVTAVTACGKTMLPLATTVTFPLTSPTALEAVEGMLVRVATPMTVTDTFTLGRFGELGLSSGGRLFVPTNGQGGSRESNRLRTLRLDDLSSRQNPATIPYLSDADPQTATRRAGTLSATSKVSSTTPTAPTSCSPPRLPFSRPPTPAPPRPRKWAAP